MISKIESSDYFFNFLNSILSKLVHDIFNPLTSIVNSNLILSSKTLGFNLETDDFFSNTNIFTVIDDSVDQIINKINLIKYLYINEKNEYIFSIKRFIDDWNKILKSSQIKIEFSKNFSFLSNHESQIFSHVLFIITNKEFEQETIIYFERINNKVVLVKNLDFALDEILNLDFNDINYFNVNLHFFKLILKEKSFSLKKENSDIILEKLN